MIVPVIVPYALSDNNVIYKHKISTNVRNLHRPKVSLDRVRLDEDMELIIWCHVVYLC